MPNTFALSVSASAGIEYFAAFSTAWSMRTIPSVTEYSLCSLSWTKHVAFTKKFYTRTPMNRCRANRSKRDATPPVDNFFAGCCDRRCRSATLCRARARVSGHGHRPARARRREAAARSPGAAGQQGNGLSGASALARARGRSEAVALRPGARALDRALGTTLLADDRLRLARRPAFHRPDRMDRFAGAAQLDHCLVSMFRRHGDHHADPAVEHPVHFVFGNVALLLQPVEQLRPRPGPLANGGTGPFRQHSRNVAGDSTARDMSQALYRNAFQQR